LLTYPISYKVTFSLVLFESWSFQGRRHVRDMHAFSSIFSWLRTSNLAP